MLRTLLLSLVVLALGACGFQLRQEVALPAEFARMRVETVDPFSPLGRDLARALQRAGVVLVEDADAPAALLRIPVDRIGSAPLTVGESGRVQEYALRYVTEIELIGADGEVVLPLQAIELSRDYTFDTAQALFDVDVVGQAEDALADDVALHHAGAAANGEGGGEQEPVRPQVGVAAAGSDVVNVSFTAADPDEAGTFCTYGARG